MAHPGFGVLVFWIAIAVSDVLGRGLAESCPTPCVCKWKSGKRAVECVDRALITIPERVDPETQVLDMSDNNLQILPRETFVRAGLLNLQKVYLRTCRLGQIDEQAFRGLTNLVELDLSNNLLTAVPSATFQDVPFLRDLTLAHNPIQKVEGLAFKHAPSLVKLDLSHCQLQSIAPRAFEGIALLEILKLNGNRLSELRPRTVETLTRLRGVELHDNPWLCDCRLREAKAWLAENNIPYPIAPVCRGGPTRVIDRTFAELHVDDFACRPEMLPVNRYVEASAGENASISCRAGAVPAASVRWYWNGRPLLNNSAFSSHQRVYIYEDGHFEKRSTLVLTHAQESDSGDFYCVAENRAGTAEANFTLHVSMRAAGMATLGGGQIAGLSAALAVLVLCVLLVILVMLVRIRRMPYVDTKTPNVQDNTQSASVIIANGKPPINSDNCTSSSPADIKASSPKARLAELSYSTSHYDANGSVLTATSPTTSTNNPDLINDTNPAEAAGSGEYTRAACDSLYPSGLWAETSENNAAAIKRTTSYDDTTPIVPIEGTDYTRCRTLPRPPAQGVYPADYGLPLPQPQLTVPSNAKTLRVWQRGGVPVLPPVNALKRALSSSRNSPDEGYQEGCGTDV